MRNKKRMPPNADKGEVTNNWKSGPKELKVKEPQSRCTKDYICVYICFDTMLKLTKDQAHSSQETLACKHLSQKERSKSYGGWNSQNYRETYFMRKKRNCYNQK